MTRIACGHEDVLAYPQIVSCRLDAVIRKLRNDQRAISYRLSNLTVYEDHASLPLVSERAMVWLQLASIFPRGYALRSHQPVTVLRLQVHSYRRDPRLRVSPDTSEPMA